MPMHGKADLAHAAGPSCLHCLPETGPLLPLAPPHLPRYVGASEENIRNLFKEAEVDYAKLGEASGARLSWFWAVQDV